jgi:Circularly permutated YpsA SLOG family
MIEKVIAGGQSGADQAGLRAARAAGIPIGGWAPRGWWVEEQVEGKRPRFRPDRPLLQSFGLVECDKPDDINDIAECFRVRTARNVRDADVTILFGSPASPGSRLTYSEFRAAKGETGRDPGMTYVRPGWISVPSERVSWPRPVNVAVSLDCMPHRVINIAGNGESRAPGIGAWVEAYLAEVFRLLATHDRSSMASR